MACSCGKLLYTCFYASRQKTEIFGLPWLIQRWDAPLVTPADFSGAPQSTKAPCGFQGAEQLSSAAPFLHLRCTPHTPLAARNHWHPLATWKAQVKYSLCFPPLAPSKVFLNGGEWNNSSQKFFLIYYILQPDRPHPAGFSWTQQQFYTSKHLGECLHTPQVTLAAFQTAPCSPFQFYQRSTANQLQLLPPLPLRKWALHKYTSTPACQENPTNGLWINHN